MNEILDIVLPYLSDGLLLLGALLIVVGSIGLLRLPDALTQVHATGMIETLGAMLLILGLMVKAGLTLVSVKLGIIMFFLVFTAPAAGHALTRAKIPSDLDPLQDWKETWTFSLHEKIHCCNFLPDPPGGHGG